MLVQLKYKEVDRQINFCCKPLKLSCELAIG